MYFFVFITLSFTILLPHLDNGSGIPADEQINIFERYFRGTNKQLAIRGLGLGLTISRMLALAMDGMLILKESSSKGTTFQLVLPKVSMC